jgi:hypothetical protein
MSLIVYADFACPHCYLASRRVDALRAAGVEVDWRAVEHHPETPIAGAHLDSVRHDTFATEFTELSGMLLPGEKLPWTMPTLIPKTEAAVSAYAEACGAGVADDVRRLLFSMYWQEGADIGNPNVLRTPLAGPILRGNSTAHPLRESGYAVSVARGPITTGAYQRIRDWRADWLQLGSQRLPALLDGAVTLIGADVVRRLGKQIDYLDAKPTPELRNPRRYPEMSVHPSAAWVSQVGQPWAYTRRPITAD